MCVCVCNFMHVCVCVCNFVYVCVCVYVCVFIRFQFNINCCAFSNVLTVVLV